TEKELSEYLNSAEGKVFSRVVLMKDISNLVDVYADQGYAFADINPSTRIDEENQKVNLTLNIEKGEKVFVEKINITGNTRTRDKVIRREIELAEGDLFSSTKLKRSKRNLNRLGFFDVLDIATVRGSAPDKIVFDVRVEERPTGSFAVGAGYSSVDNFIATVSITQNNLFGTGRRLKADVTTSSSSQRYNISFTEPWFLDKPISAGFDLFRIDKEYTDFTKFSNGGDIRFGFPVRQDTRLFLTYKLEQVEIKDVAVSAADFIQKQTGERLESSVAALLKRDSRNSFLEPTEGSVENVSVEVAGSFLGGDVNFAKYFVDVGKYFPAPLKTTFLLRGRAGYVHSLSDDPVPIFEKFFLGGLNTIRGFKSRSIGPKATDTDDVIGGDLEVIGNVEFIFPLVPKQRVKGLVFLDTGNAYDTVGDFDFSELRTGVGVGIRWLSPMGLLRLEWGFNVDPKDDEESSQFEFSIGGSF
ncbi:MAG: outer membrane protein assembly factor BamA, partial [Thermodesulfobacteriota bacterium]